MEGSLGVRHDYGGAAVGCGQGCDALRRAVGIGGIGLSYLAVVVGVLHDD